MPLDPPNYTVIPKSTLCGPGALAARSSPAAAAPPSAVAPVLSIPPPLLPPLLTFSSASAAGAGLLPPLSCRPLALLAAPSAPWSPLCRSFNQEKECKSLHPFIATAACTMQTPTVPPSDPAHISLELTHADMVYRPPRSTLYARPPAT